MPTHSARSSATAQASDKPPARPAYTEDGSNKREHDRKAINLSGEMFEHIEGELPGDAYPCAVVDISRSGVGLHSKKMVHQGRKVFVAIAQPGTPGRFKMLYGEVRYSRYVERGLYHVGVKFCDVSSSSYLVQWVERHSKGLRGK
jgi:hypothetical protein